MLEPATGATLTRVGNAVAEARAAQPAWAATPYEKRAAVLRANSLRLSSPRYFLA